MATSLKPRVVLIGVGGASCSGKTTLAKHLRSILPRSFIIHQDDFAPPEELIPYHPIHKIQDWDDPEGAIDWKRLSEALQHVKRVGEIPKGHRSHDHMNVQIKVAVDQDVLDAWKEKFTEVERRVREEKNEEVIWGIVDGFLLYWNQQVIDLLDIRIFLRVPYEVLKHRRDRRNGYHTAEGSFWQDPPNYWDNIVWPAYIKTHRDVFRAHFPPSTVSPSSPVIANGHLHPIEHPDPEAPDGTAHMNGDATETGRQTPRVEGIDFEAQKDVEKGQPTDKVERLLLLESLQFTMTELLGEAAEAVMRFTETWP